MVADSGEWVPKVISRCRARGANIPANMAESAERSVAIYSVEPSHFGSPATRVQRAIIVLIVTFIFELIEFKLRKYLGLTFAQQLVRAGSIAAFFADGGICLRSALIPSSKRQEKGPKLFTPGTLRPCPKSETHSRYLVSLCVVTALACLFLRAYQHMRTSRRNLTL